MRISDWSSDVCSSDLDYMISSANPLASQAGARILAAGGSATDALIAAQMVLNLVEPQSSGVGGGAFIVRYDAARSEKRRVGNECVSPSYYRGSTDHEKKKSKTD